MSPVPSPRPGSRSRKGDTSSPTSHPVEPAAASVAVNGAGAEPKASRSMRAGSSHGVSFATEPDTIELSSDGASIVGEEEVDLATRSAVLSSTSDFVPVPGHARTVLYLPSFYVLRTSKLVCLSCHEESLNMMMMQVCAVLCLVSLTLSLPDGNPFCLRISTTHIHLTWRLHVCAQMAKSPLRFGGSTHDQVSRPSDTGHDATTSVSPNRRFDNSAVVEQAAVVIQAAWRGYYARCADIRCATVRREIRTRRAERHIELLSGDVAMLRERLARYASFALLSE